MLKPKHTYLDQPALHYKKIIDIAKYLNGMVHYYITYGDSFKNYIYDKTQQEFVDADTDFLNGQGVLISAANTYNFRDKYYTYDIVNYEWNEIAQADIIGNIVDIYDGSTYKGQKSRYIKDRFFDYTIVSDVNENVEQIHKGLFTSNKSFDIRYYDDDIKIEDDDIVQIGNELFFVSESSKKIIRMPKPYTTYFCTLTKLKR